jgi:hypothetical protein
LFDQLLGSHLLRAARVRIIVEALQKPLGRPGARPDQGNRTVSPYCALLPCLLFASVLAPVRREPSHEKSCVKIVANCSSAQSTWSLVMTQRRGDADGVLVGILGEDALALERLAVAACVSKRAFRGAARRGIELVQGGSGQLGGCHGPDALNLPPLSAAERTWSDLLTARPGPEWTRGGRWRFCGGTAAFWQGDGGQVWFEDHLVVWRARLQNSGRTTRRHPSAR